MNITAVCPGSFDPVTLGHLDIIRRAAQMFERILVVVMSNTQKTATFSVAERCEMLKTVTAGIGNVEIESHGGLLADYAREKNAKAIVKGLRALSDFEYEFQMALTNKRLNPAADTVFLTASAENMYLSSSLVKQVGMMGGDIHDFVPECIYDNIMKKFAKSINY
ncbi:MAG: pantetheine-phosphate adenylyltransferase [Oscillospiraceae bacterium]|jgi:pantetheine-phosphate adenylyltransferase|nr:pantetheine-phosphate adenylyltransferase [Oscillospiraceae bacterium]